MTHDDAFLQEIIADPDSDTPRLVYADYLEEHGDPDRAEFIRVQCERAKLDEYDYARGFDLEARAKELLGPHEQQWLGPLRSLVPEWHFRRGFVEWVRLPPLGMAQHVQKVFQNAPVRAVWLNRMPVHPDDLLGCPELARLRRLDLDYGWSSLEAEDCERLARAEHLSGLAELRLGFNPDGPQGVGVVPLLAAGAFPGISRLELPSWSWRLRESDAVALAGLPRLARLRGLNLANNDLFDGGIRALARSPHLRGLTWLSLAHCGLTAAGARALATSGWEDLDYLDLRGNSLGAEGIRVLSAAASLRRLACLDLSSSRLGDREVQTLIRARFLPRLRELRLPVNHIGPAGAAALAQSALGPHLTWLSLVINQLGDAGVKALAAAPWEKLAWLDLRDNRITARGLAALARSPLAEQLRGLLVEGNDVPAERLRKLRPAFPRLVQADF